jgi:gliding motility-associated-like protein
VPSLAQTPIGGSNFNAYTKISSIDAINKVTVVNSTSFKAGDTAVLIQMKGAYYSQYIKHPTSYTITLGPTGTGKYEFLIIDSVVGNKIKFRSDTVLNIDMFDSAQAIQLVRVPGLENAKVTTPLSCANWDKTNQTGGVLVVYANDTLELGADIDATGKGFRGAATTYNNNTLCCPYPSFWLNDTYVDSAGLKGEGFMGSSFTYTRGQGPAGNGGGGGGGFGSGGGGGGGATGGSSVGIGGKGGRGIYNCASGNGGAYGQNSFAPYTDNRVLMGGGGGAGRAQYVNEGTAGGNGGGIVIIIANYLKTNGYTVRSNGEDVTDIAKNFAGAGGGGGGGSVMLFTNGLAGELNIEARGGNGGSTLSCSRTGQGGSGGGGLFWHSGATMLTNILNVSPGTAGTSSSCDSSSAYAGKAGEAQGDFNPVFNGFLYNHIYKTDTICYGDTPAKITGSVIKGYDGTPKYSWRKWTRSTGWVMVDGATYAEYAPPALYDTTYYQRIVKAHRLNGRPNGDTLSDYGNIVKFIIKPPIYNNQITAPADTSQCFGNTAIKIKGTVPNGGDPAFSLNAQWQISSDKIMFTDTLPGIYSKDFVANNKVTRYYRRKVINDICATYTDTIKITVHPLIGGNNIQSEQTICNASTPSEFTGNTLSGGTGAYEFRWQVSASDTLHYKDTLATSSALSALQSLPLTQTSFFRRIVYSGVNHTCSDTSNQLKVLVLPKITNNVVISQDTLVCQEVSINTLRAKVPANGDGNYRYQWLNKTKTDSWKPISVDGTSLQYKSPTLDDTTYFKRVVLSGFNNCCKDTSNTVTVNVQKKIENNVITSNQEICYGQTPVNLRGSKANELTGGDGLYSFSWQRRLLTGSWGSVSGVDNLDSLILSAHTASSYYRRNVNSGACKNSSDSLLINVLDLITGNTLAGASEVCDLSYPSAIYSAAAVGGGKTGDYHYTWQDSVTGGAWQTIAGSVHDTLNPSVLSQNTYFRRIVESGLNKCCKDTSSAFYISINSLPVVLVKTMDTALCKGTALPFNVTIDKGHQPFRLVLSDGIERPGIADLSEGSNAVSFIPGNTGTYLIDSLLDNKGCLAKDVSGKLSVRLVAVPEANVNDNIDVCGNTYQLKAIRSVGSGLWSTSSPVMFSPSDSSDQPTVTTSQYGYVRFLWKETNEFCWDTVSVLVRFDEMPVNIDAGSDQELEFTFSAKLHANAQNAGEGTWSSADPNLSFSDAHDSVATVSNLIFGVNKLLWTVVNGVCPAVTDSVKIKILDIGRYTVFTPNGDGKNDYLIFVGSENAQTVKLVIFNRGGATVYSSDNYKNDWDGTYNGKELPEDTYFYILTADGSVYKGFFVLKR